MTRILVVDDFPDARSLARVVLEREGHEVVEAGDGDEALEMLTADPSVEVLLLDIRMPRMSGWEVLDRLNESGRITNLDVIVFSAHVGDNVRAQAIDGGAVSFLEKPYRIDELVGAVRALRT